MWSKFSIISICLYLPLVWALPSSPNHVVHERRDEAPHSWVKRGRVPAEHMLPIRIGLAQSNLERGPDLLAEISDPDSPKYGQHYTAEEIYELFAPSADRVDAVLSWLSSQGLDMDRISQSVNKQWIQLELPANQLEALLKTEYHTWEHSSTRVVNVACEEYSLPDHLLDHIDYVTPGIKLHAFLEDSDENPHSRIKREQESKVPDVAPGDDELKNCANQTTPRCIQAIYNIPEGTTATPGNELGIYQKFDIHFSLERANKFFARLYPKIPAGSAPRLIGIDGGDFHSPADDDGGETQLDVQNSWPIIWPQNITIWSPDDKYYNTKDNIQERGWFNTMLDAMDGSYCNSSAYGITGDSPTDPHYPNKKPGGWNHPRQCGVFKSTNVISISYGSAEAYLPWRYMRRQCDEFMKLGMQGVTVVTISHDIGAAMTIGLHGEELQPWCPKGNLFSVSYPGSCPYVLTVGSTRWRKTADALKDPPVAEKLSGGGFSNVWEAPKYQSKALKTFFNDNEVPYKSYNTTNLKNVKKYGANGGVYNRIGRGVPDVAAVGRGDTSGAAQIWAGMITRWNEVRLQMGKKPIGFINPALYARPDLMRDVTLGRNAGCHYATDIGWNATEGWDPVSGLGVPKDYVKLEKYFKSLP